MKVAVEKVKKIILFGACSISLNEIGSVVPSVFVI